jgi:hypothetical protein
LAVREPERWTFLMRVAFQGSFGHGALTIMAERRFGESLRVRGGSADLAAQLLTEVHPVT